MPQEASIAEIRAELKKYLNFADEESIIGGIRNLAQAMIGYRDSAKSPLYCDVCGTELQRESCNHVRPCPKCSSEMQVEIDRLMDERFRANLRELKRQQEESDND